MKKTKTIHLILICGLLAAIPANMYSQTTLKKTTVKMKVNQSAQVSDTSQRVLIDKLIVPASAIKEFTERMNINRNFIRKLPGFIEDNAYQQTDEKGDLTCITVAVWKNEDAIKKAKQLVQAEYIREGFDMQAMLKRLNIVIERNIFKKYKQ